MEREWSVERKKEMILELAPDLSVEARARLLQTLRRNRYDGLNEQLMNSLWQRFHVMLEMPQAYTGNQSEPDGFPAVEIMRSGPSRGITVSWQESEDPAAVLSDRELLLDMRGRLGTAIHDEDLVPSTLIWNSVPLRER